jgi:hypothetical protein
VKIHSRSRLPRVLALTGVVLLLRIHRFLNRLHRHVTVTAHFHTTPQPPYIIIDLYIASVILSLAHLRPSPLGMINASFSDVFVPSITIPALLIAL